MPTPNTTDPVQARVAAAADSLLAAGRRVTSAAVREAAGVSMAAAVEGVRAWKEERAASSAHPDMPEKVQAQFSAVWSAVSAIAAESHRADREAFTAKLEESARSARELAEAVDKAEKEAESLRTELEAARSRLEEARAEAAAERERASARDAALREEHSGQLAAAREEAATARGEATVLREQIAALNTTLDEIRRAKKG